MIERSAAVGQPALRLLVHTIRYIRNNTVKTPICALQPACAGITELKTESMGGGLLHASKEGKVGRGVARVPYGRSILQGGFVPNEF